MVRPGGSRSGLVFGHCFSRGAVPGAGGAGSLALGGYPLVRVDRATAERLSQLGLGGMHDAETIGLLQVHRSPLLVCGRRCSRPDYVLVGVSAGNRQLLRANSVGNGVPGLGTLLCLSSSRGGSGRGLALTGTSLHQGILGRLRVSEYVALVRIVSLASCRSARVKVVATLFDGSCVYVAPLFV